MTHLRRCYHLEDQEVRTTDEWRRLRQASWAPSTTNTSPLQIARHYARLHGLAVVILLNEGAVEYSRRTDGSIAIARFIPEEVRLIGGRVGL